jgi:hypothetical protein
MIFMKINSMKKALIVFLFIILIGSASTANAAVTTAQATALDQAITTATQQAANDAADATIQNQDAQSAKAAGNQQAALLASDHASIDGADATYQQAIIAEDNLEKNGASATAIAAAQSTVDADGNALHTAQATLGTDSGNTDYATAQTAAAQTDTTAVQQNSSTGSGNFVPLTNIPILFNAVNAPTLPLFLNAIYKYMIGIAATLAVIEIMIAGVQYMGGGSVSETKDARNRIQNAVLGLVIVLAPAIVFGLINPKILNLDLGSDFNSLNTTTTAAPAATTPAASTQSQLPSYGTGAIPVVPISNAGSVPAQDTSVNAPTTVPFAPTGDTSTAYPGTEGTPITPANYGSQ